MTRLYSNTGIPVLAFDADTAEGRDGLREAFGEYELDAKVWLPFAAETYKISRNIEDYLITVTPICPSDLPNANGYAFPLAELTKFQAPPVSRQVYKAWAGTPLHREHRNEIHEDALGVVLDSSLHKIRGYGQGKLWKVMGLAALDKNKAPTEAQQMADGTLRTFSMGTDAGYITCSVCGAADIIEGRASCGHLDPNAPFKVITDFDGTQTLAFKNAHDLRPIELSVVNNPAWSMALSDTLLKT